MDEDEAYRILDKSDYSFQIKDFRERGIPDKIVGKLEYGNYLIIMNNKKLAETFGINTKDLPGNMNTKNYGTRRKQFENLVRIYFPNHDKRNKNTIIELKKRGLL